ncbi:MAG TPA: UDP-N-acetylmuramate:L-alanyl-gamma-D-glutamyl-meso-diaminopimelate ligase [Steroidobacteraceae bacterium]|jgi:UDP-N-acetylmuramate: L-alanyl-gamma-D-glutamyl-meso-diaminopimelate ligase|nr:UDP-N-acetylmuramate:L-alanyl-gamma-D-glutamyl-meso-diaminopimelate ligase [Steroidobacteraceae bacterium]
MHVHILGIAGTFMGGLAAIAKAAGHRVTGSDLNIYPPMSTQLEALGIEFVQGYGAEQLDLRPDLIVVGNALSRGRPVVEAMLDRGLPYTSGPGWLAEHVLAGRHVMAVAGTHGKTTTTAMLCWILEEAGLQPGFLIGGVPSNFDVTARLGAGACFVIEADEYDTAFFDKRAKFVHYRPRTAILNNLEYDHADIYPDVASIRRQFNQLLRMVPGSGRLIVNGRDAELAATLKEGCWTPVEHFAPATPSEGGTSSQGGTAARSQGGTAGASGADGAAPAWTARMAPGAGAGRFEVLFGGRAVAEVRWPLLGEHNVMNGLAAIAAARHVGVDPARAAAALGSFLGVKRRMEIRGVVGGVTVYDDFAHHPTAIETTLEGLRTRVGDARIVAVVEPRSNTMKLGVHREQMAPALADADRTWFLTVPELGWDLKKSVAALGPRASFADSVDALVAALAAESRPGDHVLVMSNGGFGGLHEKLLAALRARP